MISALLLIICAYVAGSIPSGFWLVKALKGIDVRKFGSGSTGATNVWRAAGPAAGIFVFFFDTIKGYIPVAVSVYMDNHGFESQWNFAYPHLVPSIVAAAALIGHSRSVFLKFQGGKSAATDIGTLLALSPMGGTCTFLTWMLIVKVSGYISLASILGVGSCPFWFYAFGAPWAAIAYCVFGFIYVTYGTKQTYNVCLKEPNLRSVTKRKLKPQNPQCPLESQANTRESNKRPDTTSSTTEPTT